MVFVSVAAQGFCQLTLASKLWLTKAYLRAKAMEVASLKMEEARAKSYSGLMPSAGLRCVGADWKRDDLGEAGCLESGGVPLRWRVDVSPRTMNSVPYKKASVSVSYDEKGAATAQGTQRGVSLENYVVYPFIHVLTQDVGSSDAEASAGGWSTVLTQDFNFPVKKNIQVAYNIALSVDDTSGIMPLHTLYTRCRIVVGAANLASFPETRTPILTQPLINNWTQIDNVPAGQGRLIVEWRKEAASGKVTPQSGNIIAVAVENL